MKIRKLVSLGLAVIMLLSVSAQIFAAEETPANTTVFTSTYSEPDIDVTVPKTGAVALNPLGLDVDLSGDGDATQTIKGQQIVTTPSIIVNNSSMNLSVSASVATTIDGGASKITLTANQETLVGKGTDPDAAGYVAASTKKAAFVFFQMAATTLTDPTDTEGINKAAAKWAYDYTEETKKDSEGNDTIVPKEGCVVLKGGSTVTGDNLVTLKAAKDGEPVSGSIAQMRLAGKLVKAPKKAEDAWKADDKIVATVTFTFSPA